MDGPTENKRRFRWRDFGRSGEIWGWLLSEYSSDSVSN